MPNRSDATSVDTIDTIDTIDSLSVQARTILLVMDGLAATRRNESSTTDMVVEALRSLRRSRLDGDPKGPGGDVASWFYRHRKGLASIAEFSANGHVWLLPEGAKAAAGEVLRVLGRPIRPKCPECGAEASGRNAGPGRPVLACGSIGQATELGQAVLRGCRGKRTLWNGEAPEIGMRVRIASGLRDRILGRGRPAPEGVVAAVLGATCLVEDEEGRLHAPMTGWCLREGAVDESALTRHQAHVLDRLRDGSAVASLDGDRVVLKAVEGAREGNLGAQPGTVAALAAGGCLNAFLPGFDGRIWSLRPCPCP